ncbi:protein trichome birefringence-like 1 [Canna indica]|uniref:Protein trichome birefringence-like 1 n=1 Tax=Canna indica TaxID=4628 RepID=A0AAQ3K9B7_9LILI|nr:protein trichome birefringence-like 1 [Canna indica]
MASDSFSDYAVATDLSRPLHSISFFFRAFRATICSLFLFLVFLVVLLCISPQIPSITITISGDRSSLLPWGTSGQVDLPSSAKKEIEKIKNDVVASCDIFDGRWEYDESSPMYPPGSCPLVEEAFDCFGNGRPDLRYTKLRWKPKDCDIPRENFYQEGEHVFPRLSAEEAFGKALRTWATWVQTHINRNRTQVFFRGYSWSHFDGGQWNSGGNCHNETEPITDEKHLTEYLKLTEILESVMREMAQVTSVIRYLNITRMTDYRKDAHPSLFRQKNATMQFQDCSHWCLPGVPDAWNQLLFAMLL